MALLRPIWPSTALLALLLALAGCAGTAGPPSSNPVPSAAGTRSERVAIVSGRVADARRLARVGERVLFAGAPLCGERVVTASGFMVWNAYSYGARNATLLTDAFGLADALRVQAVGERTPAAEAGLRRGDEILAIEGRPAPRGEGAARDALEQLAALNKSAAPYTLTVRRFDERHKLTVTPRERCAYGYAVTPKGEVNAAADGRNVYMNRGMLRFTRTDDELALIFGHELAHNTLSHVQKSQVTSVAGSLAGKAIDLTLGAFGIPTIGLFSTLGSVAGSQAFSLAHEKQADLEGLRFAARAGYDVRSAVELWQRLAEENPGSSGFLSSHPSPSERLAAMREAAREIQPDGPPKPAPEPAANPESRKSGVRTPDIGQPTRLVPRPRPAN